jgi:hypothetical protein
MRVLVIRLLILVATVLVAFGLAAGVFTPTAGAIPGQCVSGPFASFCDEPVQRNGSYLHCQSAGWGPFYSSNCYQVCARTGAILPVAVDADFYDVPC